MVSQPDMAQFLRCVSRTHLRKTDVDCMLHFLQKDIHWEHLVMLAETEGVAGLLFHHLKNRGLIDLLSKSILRNLENTYHQTTQNTLAIVAKAVALSALLKQAQIPIVALQGLSVVRLYRDPGLRPMLDADLMVKPGDKERLKGLLWEAGYRTPYFMYSDRLSKDGLFLDIHTHILNLDRIQNRRYLFPEDLTPMWERAIPYFDQHDYLLVLDPYDNIIALAAHALKHSYSRLIWLADLHESLLSLADNPDAWEEMVERARFWKQERVVLYATILMERIFDLKVPVWVKSDLGIQRLNVFEKHLIRLKLRGLSSNELCIALWLCNINGIGNKLKFITETVFPRKEIMSQIFPRSSGKVKRFDYAKRIVNTIILLCKNLGHTLAIYLRARKQ